MSISTIGFAAETHHDVEYSNNNGIILDLDASIPEGGGPFPAVIIVHGGGWVGGSRKVDVAPLFRPLTDAGFAWFTIDYTLATSPMNFGAAIDDVKTAIRFVKGRAREYRVDPDRMALIGESAGGQLAAMAALSNEPGISVKGVVGIYAPTDLVSLLENSDLIPSSVRRNLQGTPLESLLVSRLTQLSPIDNIHAGMPSFLLIHGTADPLVPFAQSREMCSRMQSVGASCELFKVPGGGHGIRRWETDPAITAPWKTKMIDWLKEQLADNPIRAL